MDLQTIQQQFKDANVSDTFGTKKEIKYLPEIMDDDEVVQYATSGMVNGNTVLVVCTNERVLFVDKGMIYGVKSNEIPLDMVNSVSYSKGMMFGKISVVNGAITTEIDQVDKATAPIMADTIKKTAKEYKANLHQLNNGNDNGDTLNKIISQNEQIIALLEKIANK
ncbi:MAG TPA: PH domain-containing protein [Ligilactobacillus acidipiscis]|jgi:hypothetical protein|uniref:PH domain-containing protein n=1 Tax=Ligilactobacillus acidipiscis TaxID=89059 RepID=A0A921K1E3_9LACO|nr:PH domain-containing protein [Ligilactobacillus acidipiscis]